MDSGTVKTFCDAAHQLLPQLGEYASTAPDKRKQEDDALVRQLRIAGSALANVMIEVARMTPPPMPPMPTQAAAQSSASAPSAPPPAKPAPTGAPARSA